MTFTVFFKQFSLTVFRYVFFLKTKALTVLYLKQLKLQLYINTTKQSIAN